MNLKQKLSKKLKKSGGFTLIEMLIVVSIIAILVAVSIPMVNASLEKARKATDDANERAAKAAAIAEYLLNDANFGTPKTYCYDAASGKAIEKTGGTCPTNEGTAIASYGNGTASRGSGHVEVTVKADGGTDIVWTAS